MERTLSSFPDDVVKGVEGPMETVAENEEDETFVAMDDHQWDGLDDEEEEDVSIRGFDNAFTDAMNPDEHAQDVEGLLSCLGVQTEDSSLPWERVLLHLFDMNDATKTEVLRFAESCVIDRSPYPDEENYDSPAKGTRTWPSQDIEIDQEWNSFVKSIDALSDQKVIGRALTKPTGKWNFPLAIIWNYPSWTSPNIEWAQVLDRSNPCVGMQYAKLGPSPHIRTQNRIPIRADYKAGGILWESLFPKMVTNGGEMP